MINTRALGNASVGVLALYYMMGKKPPDLLLFASLLMTGVSLAVEVPKIVEKNKGAMAGCCCKG